MHCPYAWISLAPEYLILRRVSLIMQSSPAFIGLTWKATSFTLQKLWCPRHVNTIWTQTCGNMWRHDNNTTWFANLNRRWSWEVVVYHIAEGTLNRIVSILWRYRKYLRCRTQICLEQYRSTSEPALNKPIIIVISKNWWVCSKTDDCGVQLTLYIPLKRTVNRFHSDFSPMKVTAAPGCAMQAMFNIPFHRIMNYLANTPYFSFVRFSVGKISLQRKMCI